MPDEGKRNVVDVVFELREAAIAHGQALEQAAHDDDPATVDALLESQLDLEGKTAAAIEECEDDGTQSATSAADATSEKVVHVDFTSPERTLGFTPEGA